MTAPLPPPSNTFGEVNTLNLMYGGIMILLAAWGAGGNMLLAALLYQNNVWTLINRVLMAISWVSIFQSVFCILPVGVAGINEQWSFGNTTCDAYPYIYSFSQMTMMYLMALLLIYNIFSLTHEKQAHRLKSSTFWIPPLLFVIPYIIFLPPSMVFVTSEKITHISQDASSLYACTVLPTETLSMDYRAYNGIESIIGFLIPYLATIVLFGYLIVLINKRKANKVSKVHIKDLEDPYIKETNLSESAEYAKHPARLSPVERDLPSPTLSDPVVSLSARSDLHTEVVVLVIAFTFILSFSPMLFLKMSEIFAPASFIKSDALRWYTLLASFMVIVVNPTIYTLQYPTIKEAVVKLDMHRIKGNTLQKAPKVVKPFRGA